MVWAMSTRTLFCPLSHLYWWMRLVLCVSAVRWGVGIMRIMHTIMHIMHTMYTMHTMYITYTTYTTIMHILTTHIRRFIHVGGM